MRRNYNKNEFILNAYDLHKSFGELEVLRGVSLEARPGDVVALLGASGSGKSTFLRCLNLLETPNKGTVRVDGETIEMREKGGKRVASDRRQLQRIRGNLAMVFQGFNLWEHMTVLQNVSVAPMYVLGVPKREAYERGREMLEHVNLETKENAYPAQLSGGQQQRVAIARALAMHPKVILFDEPTSSLDPELVSEVLQTIRSLADEGHTMLIVTHEVRFARDVSNSAIFLHEGRIEEEGKPAEVLDNPKSERLQRFLASHLGN